MTCNWQCITSTDMKRALADRIFSKHDFLICTATSNTSINTCYWALCVPPTSLHLLVKQCWNRYSLLPKFFQSFSFPQLLWFLIQVFVWVSSNWRSRQTTPWGFKAKAVTLFKTVTDLLKGKETLILDTISNIFNNKIEWNLGISS